MGDSIADCVDEVRRLHAPLGTWGCNGNHEIYARVEDEAESLYVQAGMRLLRHENSQLTFKGAQFISSAWIISASALPTAKDNKLWPM